MSEKLEIEKERVLKAAERCPQAKEILREIFPEAFEKAPGLGWEEITEPLVVYRGSEESYYLSLEPGGFIGEIIPRNKDEYCIIGASDQYCKIYRRKHNR